MRQGAGTVCMRGRFFTRFYLIMTHIQDWNACDHHQFFGLSERCGTLGIILLQNIRCACIFHFGKKEKKAVPQQEM